MKDRELRCSVWQRFKINKPGTYINFKANRPPATARRKHRRTHSSRVPDREIRPMTGKDQRRFWGPEKAMWARERARTPSRWYYRHGMTNDWPFLDDISCRPGNHCWTAAKRRRWDGWPVNRFAPKGPTSDLTPAMFCGPKGPVSDLTPPNPWQSRN